MRRWTLFVADTKIWHNRGPNAPKDGSPDRGECVFCLGGDTGGRRLRDH